MAPERVNLPDSMAMVKKPTFAGLYAVLDGADLTPLRGSIDQRLRMARRLMERQPDGPLAPLSDHGDVG